MPNSSRLTRVVSTITAIAVAVGAILAVFSNMDGAVKGWCNNVGFYCSNEISKTISASVSPGNPCSNDNKPLCLEPTSKYRRFVVSSIQFEAKPGAHPLGRYYNNGKDQGGPKLNDAQSGWELTSEATPKKICLRVFARTGVCEDKYSIIGQFKVTERTTIW